MLDFEDMISVDGDRADLGTSLWRDKYSTTSYSVLAGLHDQNCVDSKWCGHIQVGDNVLAIQVNLYCNYRLQHKEDWIDKMECVI